MQSAQHHQDDCPTQAVAFASKIRGGNSMRETTKSTQKSPRSQKPCAEDDAVVNDSLGTVTPADSTGAEEDDETSEAKNYFKSTDEN
jgi:hypothetical protein